MDDGRRDTIGKDNNSDGNNNDNDGNHDGGSNVMIMKRGNRWTWLIKKRDQ